MSCCGCVWVWLERQQEDFLFTVDIVDHFFFAPPTRVTLRCLRCDHKKLKGWKWFLKTLKKTFPFYRGMVSILWPLLSNKLTFPIMSHLLQFKKVFSCEHSSRMKGSQPASLGHTPEPATYQTTRKKVSLAPGATDTSSATRIRPQMTPDHQPNNTASTTQNNLDSILPGALIWTDVWHSPYLFI